MDSNTSKENRSGGHDSEQLEQQKDLKQQEQQEQQEKEDVNVAVHFIINRSYHYYRELLMLVIQYQIGQIFLIVTMVSK